MVIHLRKIFREIHKKSGRIIRPLNPVNGNQFIVHLPDDSGHQGEKRVLLLFFSTSILYQHLKLMSNRFERLFAGPTTVVTNFLRDGADKHIDSFRFSPFFTVLPHGDATVGDFLVTDH